MRGILLAGMVDKEAAAIEIMVGMYWKNRTCVTLARTPGLKVPQQASQACPNCDICVVDLFGLGMRRHSEEHEQRLLKFLDGRLAVLLLRGLENGWMKRVLPLAPGQQVQCLMTPYKAHSLRECISKLLQVQKPAMVSNASAVVASVPAGKEAIAESLPAWRRAEQLAIHLQLTGNRTAAYKPLSEQQPLPADDQTTKHALETAPKTVAQQSDSKLTGTQKKVQPAFRQQTDAVGLSRGAMDALLTMFPSFRSLPVVALTMKIVTSSDTLLLKAQPDTEIVLNFRQGWLVCDLSVSDLRKLAVTPHFASSMQIIHLPEQYVESLMTRRQNGRLQRAQVALDEVAWHLYSDALKGHRLAPQGDMRIQLRGFPNITALDETTSLDIQLATICARAPHYVSDLLRAFPRHEQDVLRFVVLAIASGLMCVLADDVSNLQAHQVPATAASKENSPTLSSQVRAQRSFFKSLLEKLF